uniref:Uncharacterized protein n=1 Tax=Tanacetum cinerariifolium TaxID=118510 RepID=A0A699ISP7_TANCI|nr:hypothetical protein [Tanacetum cinerariifolium]
MSAKHTAWNEFSSAMALAMICLYTGDLSTHTTKYISPALTQKVFANMRRVGKGCSGVETPLFKGMLVARVPEEQSDAEEHSTDGGSRSRDYKAEDKGDEAGKGQQGRMIDELDRDEGVVLMSEKEEKKAEEEAVEVVTTTKLIIEVVAAVSEIVSAATIVPAATKTAASVKLVIPSTRRRRGVVIRDPEEESSAKTPTEAKSKDKGKGIMVEELTPIKKKQQVELDEAYARKLHEKLNQNIDLEVTIDHVKQKAKENPYVQRLDYFKEMSYDDIRPIFEANFNSNIEFLLKSKEKIEEEENRVIKSINETLAQKATKRRRLNEEAEDVEELKQHLEIMPDEDDDLIMLVKRRCPLLRFTLDQMLNAVRLRVEEQSEMSLELIRFTRQQLQEGQHD